MRDYTKNRRVFITGGTGSVGRELIRLFAQNGDQVLFQFHTDLNMSQELQRTCGAQPLQIDLSGDFKLPMTDFDVVINNAGINPTGSITHEVSRSDFDLTLRVNLRAPFQICQECLPFMISNSWGRIINISSIYGLRGVDWNLPYNVSKHGLSGLTKSVAKDYASRGITCNEICPGPLDSDMMKRIAKEEGAAKGQSVEEYLRDYAQQIPAKRLGSPREVASLALYLASPDAAYLTGASVPLDGGWIE